MEKRVLNWIHDNGHQKASPLGEYAFYDRQEALEFLHALEDAGSYEITYEPEDIVTTRGQIDSHINSMVVTFPIDSEEVEQVLEQYSESIESVVQSELEPWKHIITFK